MKTALTISFICVELRGLPSWRWYSLSLYFLFTCSLLTLWSTSYFVIFWYPKPKLGFRIVPHGCFELFGLTDDLMAAEDMISSLVSRCSSFNWQCSPSYLSHRLKYRIHNSKVQCTQHMLSIYYNVMISKYQFFICRLIKTYKPYWPIKCSDWIYENQYIAYL